MGVESLNDADIASFINSEKKVESGSKKFIERNKMLLADYKLTSDDGTEFRIYARQNLRMINDFSCGLSVKLADGSSVTLCRYNGSSHPHTNSIEGDKVDFVCHIHRATERYIAVGRKPEHFAEASDSYNTLVDAVKCLATDCNISGLELPIRQNEMTFDE